MNTITRMFAIALVAVMGISGVDAKSGGFSSSSSSSSSSSRSSSSYSSRSFGSSSKSYTAPKSTYTAPPKSPSSGFGSSSKTYSPTNNTAKSNYNSNTSTNWGKPNTAKPQTSPRPTSAVDIAKYKAATKNGTTFKTRESAIADFKAKKGSTYTSKYVTEPTTRPRHIPQQYQEGGQSYNITYNSGYGGYGYMNTLGTFMLYDIMTDNANLNRTMTRDNYYVGLAPRSPWTTFWFSLLTIALIGGIIAAIFFGYRHFERN